MKTTLEQFSVKRKQYMLFVALEQSGSLPPTGEKALPLNCWKQRGKSLTVLVNSKLLFQNGFGFW